MMVHLNIADTITNWYITIFLNVKTIHPDH